MNFFQGLLSCFSTLTTVVLKKISLFLIAATALSLGACSSGDPSLQVLGSLEDSPQLNDVGSNGATPTIADPGADLPGPTEDGGPGGKWGRFDEAVPLPPKDPEPGAQRLKIEDRFAAATNSDRDEDFDKEINDAEDVGADDDEDWDPNDQDETW